MCHLLLLLPLIALPVFWLLPLEAALPVYLVVVLLSGALYWVVARSMSKRPEAGAESLIGIKAEVLCRLPAVSHAQYLARACGELWSADSTEVLRPGEQVNVAGVDGVKLLLTRGAVNPDNWRNVTSAL